MKELVFRIPEDMTLTGGATLVVNLETQTLHVSYAVPAVHQKMSQKITPLRSPKRNTIPRLLSDEDIRAIRAAYASGDATQLELAQRYNVVQSAINRVVNGKTYKDVV